MQTSLRILAGSKSLSMSFRVTSCYRFQIHFILQASNELITGIGFRLLYCARLHMRGCSEHHSGWIGSAPMPRPTILYLHSLSRPVALAYRFRPLVPLFPDQSVPAAAEALG
jgi:hypothetical protein